jgi:hypothetical protein
MYENLSELSLNLDSKYKQKYQMLPRFLLADNSQEYPDNVYVVHTEHPRFIVESNIDDFEQNRVIYWIDTEPENEDIIENLLEEAADFLEDELNSQEDLYDEEFGMN